MSKEMFKLKHLAFYYDDLFKVSETEILKNVILGHYIFHLKKRGEKPLLILRAGDIVDEERLNHFKKKKFDNFYYLSLVSSDRNDLFFNSFNELHKISLIPNQEKIADEIIYHFSKLYFQGNENESLLLFVNSCFEFFFNLDVKLVKLIFRNNPKMYSKVLISSAMSIIVAISNGIYNTQILSDLYNASFLMDFSLSSRENTYFIQFACEAERKIPGSGLKLLSKLKVSKEERKLFFYHPIESFKLANNYKDKFYYPEILHCIKVQHENNEGTGFPHKLCKSTLSNWETILMTADTLVPFEEHLYSSLGEDKMIFNWVTNVEKTKNYHSSAFKSCLLKFKSSMNWAIGRKNVA